MEGFIFERSGGGLRAWHPDWTSSWGSPGSIWRIASTRLLRGCRVGQELRYRQQAVAADREHRHEAGAAVAVHPQLAYRPPVLAPPKASSMRLRIRWARPIAPVACGTRIDR